MSKVQTDALLRALACCGVVFLAATVATATEYDHLDLHARVEASDVVVLARVVDPAAAVMNVERVLKGAAPPQITLVEDIDSVPSSAQPKPLVADARELLFLIRKGDAYAPVQRHYGRMGVTGDRLFDPFSAEPRSLSQTVASIGRLIPLQTRAARGGSEADQAYVAAFASPDDEVQKWALQTSFQRVKTPSRALADALLAHWTTATGDDAGLVANAVVKWRLGRAAPLFAETLKTSTDERRRAAAATALGGTGDRRYLPLLRAAAAGDPSAHARALAYGAIVRMIGPDALADLRHAAEDRDALVRAHAVSDAYNLLEFSTPERRFPPPSAALVAEVRTFLTEMQRDSARVVSDNARAMLGMIGRQPR